MIDYSCPKCDGPMSSPDSLAGKTEQCPACGNVCHVPKRQSVIAVAKAIDVTGSFLGRFRRFYGRRKRLTWVVAASIVALCCLVSWIWLARQAAKGLLPPHEELAKLLANERYYPSSDRPVAAVLQGRKLHRFDYVKNAKDPDWGTVSLYCPLNDDSRPIALTTMFVAGKEGIEGIKEYEDLLKADDKTTLAQRYHQWSVEQLIGHLISMDWAELPVPSENDLRKSTPDALGDWSVPIITKRFGFCLEIVFVYNESSQVRDDHLVGTGVILKDRTWQ